MKTVTNWFLLLAFALQASGVVWFAHLAESSGPEESVPCRRGHDHAAARTLTRETLRDLPNHSAVPAKGSPHGHDPAKCSICQFLLILRAATTLPPALPAVHEAAFVQLVASDRPAADTFLPGPDARGPPALAL